MFALGLISGMLPSILPQVLTNVKQQNENTQLAVALSELENQSFRENMVITAQKRIYESRQQTLAEYFKATAHVAEGWRRALGG